MFTKSIIFATEMTTMEEKGKYSSIEVARYLWAYADDKSYILDITKLLKLLYIIYGIYLIRTDERLVDEPVHAWPYGPVFPKVRKDFLKNNRYKDITIDDPTFDKLKEDETLNACIKSTLKKFGNWYANELINWTHRDNSAWSVTTQKDGFHWNDIIEDKDIKDYFNKIYVWQ